MRRDEVRLHRSLFDDGIGVLFSTSHVSRRGEELAGERAKKMVSRRKRERRGEMDPRLTTDDQHPESLTFLPLRFDLT